jgi:hypothetical protein
MRAVTAVAGVCSVLALVLEGRTLTGWIMRGFSRLIRLDLVGTFVPMHCAGGRNCCRGMSGGLA